MAKLYWKDINGKRHELDTSNYISSMVGGAKFSGGKPTPQSIATMMQPHLIFPADIMVGRGRGNVYETKINYNIFEDPGLAKKILPIIQKEASNLSGKWMNFGADYNARKMSQSEYIKGIHGVPKGLAAADKAINDQLKSKGVKETMNFQTAPKAQFAGSAATGLSAGAKSLVDQALKTQGRDLKNLGGQPWWTAEKNDAIRLEAWNTINKITGSAKEMANYVLAEGLQNLQSLPWWSESGNKTEAWKLIQDGQKAATGTAPKTTSEIQKVTPATSTATTTTTTTAPTTTADTGFATYKSAIAAGFVGSYTDWAGSGRPAGKVDTTKAGADATKADATATASPIDDSAVKAAMKIIQNDKSLSEDEKSLFSRIVTDIDVSRGISLENILKEFQKQKTSTIDPEFKAQTDFFIDQLQSSVKFQEQDRIREIEAERALSGENIRQAKAGLEKAGMTFTGKGIEQLGAQSAYSQTDQIPFGGAYFEGKTQQANRLMSSGSLARYQKNLQTLGTQAEGTLGSGAATLQNIPGYKASGNITGSLEENRQKMLAATASSIYDKEAARAKAAQPISQKVATNLNLNNL